VSSEIEILLSQRRQLRLLRHHRWLNSDFFVLAERSIDHLLGEGTSNARSAMMEGGWACWTHPRRLGTCVAVVYKIVVGGALSWLSLDGFVARQLLYTQMECLRSAIQNESCEGITVIGGSPPIFPKINSGDALGTSSHIVAEGGDMGVSELRTRDEPFPSLDEIISRDGFVVAKEGGLHFIDYEEIAKQRGCGICFDWIVGICDNAWLAVSPSTF
jgi:hypothetical protein